MIEKGRGFGSDGHMKNLTLGLLILCSCSDDAPQGWSFIEPTTATTVDATVQDMPDPGPQVTPAERVFEGIWRVDQPSHAGYEVTLYEFGERGVLREIESIGMGSGQVPTGRVARCDEFQVDGSNCVAYGPECLFSNEWKATDAQTLLITSACDDGQRRKVSIHFEGDLEAWQSPKVSVSGDENWFHNDFEWAWTQCVTVEECRVGF